jgi:hypothetical protein
MEVIRKWLLTDVPVETREKIKRVAKRHKTTVGNAIYIIVKAYKEK